MEISDHELTDFQAAYAEDFGESISTAEAREMLQRLVTFYEVVSRPLPSSASEAGDTAGC
jgi:hypothetical protein